MTVKDASEFWQTLKRESKTRSVSRHKPEISAENGIKIVLQLL